MSKKLSPIAGAAMLCLVLSIGIANMKMVPHVEPSRAVEQTAPAWHVDAGFESDAEAQQYFARFWESSAPAPVCCGPANAAEQTAGPELRLESCGGHQRQLSYDACGFRAITNG